MKTSQLSSVALFASFGMAQVKVPPEFKPGSNLKWQIEIQNTIDTSKPLVPSVTVWDIDLYHAARSPDVISYLRSQSPDNITVICYFNAGLVQTSDCDYSSTWDTPAYRGLLGRQWPEFPDERWVNIKNGTSHELIKRRIALANRIGCDAVDPDNIDGYGVDSDTELPDNEKTGWNLVQEDDIKFMKNLSTYAHSLTTLRGYTMLIGQKNAPELASALLQYVDFAVLEDCKSLFDNKPENAFCSEFQPFVTGGNQKPVLSIEYPTSLENGKGTGNCRSTGGNDAQYKASCDATKGNAGFTTVLKIKEGKGELNGCTQYCDAGVGKGVVVTATNSTKDGLACPAGST